MNKYDEAVKLLQHGIDKLQKTYKNIPYKELSREVENLTEKYLKLTGSTPPDRYLTLLANMLLENSYINESKKEVAS